MNKFFAVFLVLSLAAAGLVFCDHPATESAYSEDLGFYLKSTVTFVNDGNEIWNLTEDDRSWNLFMNDSWQSACIIGHAHPLDRIDVDADGNALAVFNFQPTLQPNETVTDYIVYHIRSKPRLIPILSLAESETADQIPPDLQAKYCSGSGFWMTNDPQLRQKAFEIAGSETNVLAIVTKFISFMWQNIRYQPHDLPLYPNETLSLSEGDCDEQAILLGTFLRILRIPTYLQVGCVFLPEENSSSQSGRVHFVQRQIAWHGWTMAYIPPWGWMPVDLTYVTGGKSNPTNAIKTGAVAMQYTLQWMNVSENDYLTSDRAYERLLEQHRFSLYVTDEIDLANPLLGDVDGDQLVNIVDIAIAARAYGAIPTSQNWNSTVDINKDENVNIIDISIIAREYGMTD